MEKTKYYDSKMYKAETKIKTAFIIMVVFLIRNVYRISNKSFRITKQKRRNKKEQNRNREMTTREIAQELFNRKYTNTADVNNARPRVTELESLGFVTTDKTKKCNVTNKEVAVYRETTEIEKMVMANMKHIPEI